MSTQEAFAGSAASNGTGQKRVVEAEIRFPKIEEMDWPKVNLEPVKSAATDVLLTSLGVGVLLVRGVIKAVEAAHQAGAEAVEHPGPVLDDILGAVRGKRSTEAEPAPSRVKVPVLPLDGYDQLVEYEIAERLVALTAEQLETLRDYESSHANRESVIEAIERRLAAK